MAASPPVAGIRKISLPAPVVKRIVPSAFHDPPSRDGFSQGRRRSAIDVDPLEFAIREEPDGPAVRRPERISAPFGSGQRLRRDGIQRPQPQAGPPLGWPRRRSSARRARGRRRCGSQVGGVVISSAHLGEPASGRAEAPIRRTTAAISVTSAAREQSMQARSVARWRAAVAASGFHVCASSISMPRIARCRAAVASHPSAGSGAAGAGCRRVSRRAIDSSPARL